MRVVRSDTAVTLSWGRCISSVQICLTLARDPLELLSSFDIAPCKMAFDGSRLIMTETAEFFLDHNIFALSPTTYQVTSDKLAERVLKYCYICYNPKYAHTQIKVICLDDRLAYAVPDNINPYEEQGMQYSNSHDSWYSIVDSDELNADYNSNTFAFDETGALEKAMIELYRERPHFVVLRHRDRINGRGLDLGVNWDLTELSYLWSLIKDADKWYDYITDPQYLGYLNEPKYVESVWAGVPKPSQISTKLRFLSLKDLLVLLEARRSLFELQQATANATITASDQ